MPSIGQRLVSCFTCGRMSADKAPPAVRGGEQATPTRRAAPGARANDGYAGKVDGGSAVALSAAGRRTAGNAAARGAVAGALKRQTAYTDGLPPRTLDPKDAIIYGLPAGAQRDSPQKQGSTGATEPRPAADTRHHQTSHHHATPAATGQLPGAQVSNHHDAGAAATPTPGAAAGAAGTATPRAAAGAACTATPGAAAGTLVTPTRR